ncbi:MAG: hypothetical protein ABFS56_23485 [Pseudomonadota bacterium]
MWGDNEKHEKPSVEENQTEAPSYWESLKSKVSEKAKAVGKISGIAKDKVAEKASNLLTDTEELRFEEVYNKPFWKNDTVFWSTIAVASATAAAVTVFTAGTGAPAAGVGVSTIASHIAGGGAGSYMAGLSTVGHLVGGNAITGAAILNGVSAGILGFGGEAAAIKGIAATTKLALASATKFGEFGFKYLSLKKTSEATYLIQIIPSSEFGTGKVGELFTRLKEANKNLTETLAKHDETKTQLNSSFNQAITVINEKYQGPTFKTDRIEMAKKLAQLRTLNGKIIAEKKKIEAERLTQQYQVVIQETHGIIEAYLSNKASSSKESRTDAMMSAILLHSLGYENDFVNYIKQFQVATQNESFLLYLKAVAYLLDKDFEVARKYALQAMDTEPEAIEPVMVLIMALDGLGQYQQAFELETLLKEEFDDDHYETPNSLLTAYNLLGDIANSRQLPQTAVKFHQKAFDKTSFFSDDDEKALLCLKIANDYHLFGSKRKSTEYYEKAIGYVEDEELKKEINLFFKENIQTQLVLK